MIKNYKNFIIENNISDQLKSIRAEKVLMGDIINFNSENFNDIELLSKDPEFLRKLDKKGFKKNNIENTRDCSTFLENDKDFKFFLIFKKEESELDPTPEYIVIQTHNGIETYKINDNIRKFYDTLSSKTIEIKNRGKNYIYRTSNAGNDWTLQNIGNKDNQFKDIMSNDEIKAKLKSGASKNIID